MIEPAVLAALVVLATWGLKLLVNALGLPLDDATLNALATALVAYLLGLFGIEVARKVAPGLRARGLLK